MSQIPNPLPPVHAYPVPGPGSRGSWLGCAFALSFLINLAAGLLIIVLCFGVLFRSAVSSDVSGTLPEKYVVGSKTASDKIAIVTIDGIIMEGALAFAHKQIEQVGKDSSVKAIVVRV